MEVVPPRDATIVLRVWSEAHDPEPRGRISSTLEEAETTARGVDEIVAVVERTLRRFSAG